MGPWLMMGGAVGETLHAGGQATIGRARWRWWRVAAGCTLALAIGAASCAKTETATTSDPSKQPSASDSTTATAATSGGTGAGTATTKKRSTATTKGAVDDKALAESALITKSDLPSGSWNEVPAKDSDDKAFYKKVPACAAFVDRFDEVDRLQVAKAQRQWNDKRSSSNSLTDSVAVFGDQTALDTTRELYTDAGFVECVRGAIALRLDEAVAARQVKVASPVVVESTPIGLTAADLGVDFVAAFTIRYSLETRGEKIDFSVQTVTLVKGRAGSEVTVSGSGRLPLMHDTYVAAGEALVKAVDAG